MDFAAADPQRGRVPEVPGRETVMNPKSQARSADDLPDSFFDEGHFDDCPATASEYAHCACDRIVRDMRAEFKANAARWV